MPSPSRGHGACATRATAVVSKNMGRQQSHAARASRFFRDPEERFTVGPSRPKLTSLPALGRAHVGGEGLKTSGGEGNDDACDVLGGKGGRLFVCACLSDLRGGRHACIHIIHPTHNTRSGWPKNPSHTAHIHNAWHCGGRPSRRETREGHEQTGRSRQTLCLGIGRLQKVLFCSTSCASRVSALGPPSLALLI